MYSSIVSELNDYCHEELGFPADSERKWKAFFGFPKTAVAAVLDRYDSEMGHPIAETMPFFYHLKNYPTWDVLQGEFPHVLRNYNDVSILLQSNQAWLSTMNEVLILFLKYIGMIIYYKAIN